ncbi:hypothetical protein C5L14_23250 [Labrys okinawensis]|uniref:Uncharacterized protein n=1 Tax=Labrys okinawensis TaxID=346911 RepID=A0A2S9Q7S1_9HYPH|nr:hypothetical protein [Labrys okinawensis]PRH85360.1 hypothetical protein C5L14_23250 [Labrys okinawensis]
MNDTPTTTDIVNDDATLAIVAVSAATVAYAEATPAEKRVMLKGAKAILSIYGAHQDLDAHAAKWRGAVAKTTAENVQ